MGEVSAVDDLVHLGIDALADRRRDAIHGDPAVTDSILCLSTRAESCLAQIFLDAEGSGHGEEDNFLPSYRLRRENQVKTIKLPFFVGTIHFLLH